MQQSQFRLKDLQPEEKKLRFSEERAKLIASLDTHGIPNSEDIIQGKEDENFRSFLSRRYAILSTYLDLLNRAHRNLKSDINIMW